MVTFKTAAILTGGHSIRMGRDKKQLSINGEVILQRIIDQVSVDFDDIIIVGSQQEDHPDIRGVRGFYKDIVNISASLTGILTGLHYSRSSYLYAIACDMPFYNPEYVACMKGLVKEKPGITGIVTRYGEWIEPFNAFYHVDLIKSIENYLKNGRKSIYQCVRRENLYFIDEKTGRKYSPDWEMFINLNTPRELREHVQRYKGACP